jgi:hypothetical protein
VAPDLTVTSPTVPSAYTPGGVTVIVNAAGGPDAVELATSADTTWCEVLSGATSQGASLAPEGCARTGTTIRIPLAARARDDLYRFRVFATDAAGNATDRLVEALLDVTAPIASLVAVSRPDLPPGAIEAALTRPSFPSPGCPSTGGSFNPCFEQVAEQAYELDGGPETPFVPGPRGQYLRLLGLAPGPHTLRVRVTDLAGNTRWLDPVTLTVPAPGGGTTTPAAAPSFPPAPASTTAAGVATTVACAEACAITTSGTVTVPGAARVYRLATRTTRLTRAGRVTIRTPVPKAARAAVRRAIRQGRRVEARVRVQVRTSSGTTRTKTQRVRLRR